MTNRCIVPACYSCCNTQVDLAGSERVHKTQTGGQTLVEAKHINVSLFFLEMVIVALRERGSKGRQANSRHRPPKRIKHSICRCGYWRCVFAVVIEKQTTAAQSVTPKGKTVVTTKCWERQTAVTSCDDNN